MNHLIKIEFCGEPNEIQTPKENWSILGFFHYSSNAKRFTLPTGIPYRELAQIEKEVSEGLEEGSVSIPDGVYRWEKQ